MQLPLRFPKDEDARETFGGVPAAEAATDMEIGTCSRCGEDASEKGQGILRNPRIVHGVMVGEVICIDCILADPEFDLDELEDFPDS